MKRHLHLDMQQQPDDFTCGPTCLHAVYDFYGDTIELSDVIHQVDKLDDGGTLGVLLANHALNRGYKATIYTFNLRVFDPTWFELPSGQILEKLRIQLHFKSDKPKLASAIRAYIEFLEAGGEVRLRDLNVSLIRGYLKKNIPILTGLSSTYLYRCAREVDAPDKMEYNDIQGEPTGHFVVLSGYNILEKTVKVADPYSSNPAYSAHYYHVKIDRLVNSILLGILTYDANLLILEPPQK